MLEDYSCVALFVFIVFRCFVFLLKPRREAALFPMSTGHCPLDMEPVEVARVNHTRGRVARV